MLTNLAAGGNQLLPAPPTVKKVAGANILPHNQERSDSGLEHVSQRRSCDCAIELVIALPAEPLDTKNNWAARREIIDRMPHHTVNELKAKFNADRTSLGIVRPKKVLDLDVRPGVNDPFTAINCVDRLGTALCTLAERKIPSRYRCDDDGKLRVVTSVSTIAGIVNAAFDQIRQAARHDTAVTLRILESIGAVARRTRDEEFRTALRRQAEAVHRGSRDGLKDQIDREEADQRFQSVIKSLDGVSNTAQNFPNRLTL